jgi:hypothetical protein
MDIFGKTAKPKTSFQNELTAKLKERKAAGLATDLTETEEDDDDGSEDGNPCSASLIPLNKAAPHAYIVFELFLPQFLDILAAYNRTLKPDVRRSPSPWQTETDTHQAASPVTPKSKSPSNSNEQAQSKNKRPALK